MQNTFTLRKESASDQGLLWSPPEFCISLIGSAERRDEVVRAVDLAAALSVTTAAVSLLVDRLARAGYVDRTRDPSDGRGRILCLTKRAQQAIVDTDDPTYEQIRTRVAGVPEPEATSVAARREGLSAILEAQPDVRG